MFLKRKRNLSSDSTLYLNYKKCKNFHFSMFRIDFGRVSKMMISHRRNIHLNMNMWPNLKYPWFDYHKCHIRSMMNMLGIDNSIISIINFLHHSNHLYKSNPQFIWFDILLHCMLSTMFHFHMFHKCNDKVHIILWSN